MPVSGKLIASWHLGNSAILLPDDDLEILIRSLAAIGPVDPVTNALGTTITPVEIAPGIEFRGEVVAVPLDTLSDGEIAAVEIPLKNKYNIIDIPDVKVVPLGGFPFGGENVDGILILGIHKMNGKVMAVIKNDTGGDFSDGVVIAFVNGLYFMDEDKLKEVLIKTIGRKIDVFPFKVPLVGPNIDDIIVTNSNEGGGGNSNTVINSGNFNVIGGNGGTNPDVIDINE